MLTALLRVSPETGAAAILFLTFIVLPALAPFATDKHSRASLALLVTIPWAAYPTLVTAASKLREISHAQKLVSLAALVAFIVSVLAQAYGAVDQYPVYKATGAFALLVTQLNAVNALVELERLVGVHRFGRGFSAWLALMLLPLMGFYFFHRRLRMAEGSHMSPNNPVDR